MCPRVVVGVGFDHEARVLEQGEMIFPARLANPDLHFRVRATQKVGTDLQAPGTAERLHGNHPLVFDRRTIGRPLHSAVVLGQSIDRQVSARWRALQQLALGPADSFEQGDLAVVVVVDPDP
jgi:hypothetical protein